MFVCLCASLFSVALCHVPAQGSAAFGEPSISLLGPKSHGNPRFSTAATWPTREFLLFLCLCLLLVTRQIKRCSLAFAMVPIFTTPVSMTTTDHYNDVSFTLVVDRKLRAPSPILDDAAASKGHGAGGLYHVPFRALHALVRLEPRDSGDKRSSGVSGGLGFKDQAVGFKFKGSGSPAQEFGARSLGVHQSV